MSHNLRGQAIITTIRRCFNACPTGFTAGALEQPGPEAEETSTARWLTLPESIDHPVEDIYHITKTKEHMESESHQLEGALKVFSYPHTKRSASDIQRFKIPTKDKTHVQPYNGS